MLFVDVTRILVPRSVLTRPTNSSSDFRQIGLPSFKRKRARVRERKKRDTSQETLQVRIDQREYDEIRIYIIILFRRHIPKNNRGWPFDCVMDCGGCTQHRVNDLAVHSSFFVYSSSDILIIVETITARSNPKC